MNASLPLPIFVVTGVVALVAIGLSINASAQRRRKRREAFIRSYRFPAVLRFKLTSKHPQLSTEQVELVFRALRQYFQACLGSGAVTLGGSVGMPSRVVDDLWHEFMLISREYANFCEQAFGGFLHHAPDSEMKASMQTALSNTLNVLKPRGGVPPEVATLAGIPLLFAIDKALAIPNGYYHDANTLAAIEARRHMPQNSGSCGASMHVSSGCGASTGSGCADGGSSDGGADGGGCGGGGCGSE
jgi:hypothetical protein